jgi:hypothetical protein
MCAVVAVVGKMMYTDQLGSTTTDGLTFSHVTLLLSLI